MQFEIELNESSSYPHHESPFRNQAVIRKSSVCSLVCGVRARVAFRRGACGALPSGGALSIARHIRATACAPAGLTSPAWPVGAPGSRAPAHAGARSSTPRRAAPGPPAGPTRARWVSTAARSRVSTSSRTLPPPPPLPRCHHRRAGADGARALESKGPGWTEGMRSGLDTIQDNSLQPQPNHESIFLLAPFL